jgi:hypothetical protein
MLHAFFPLPSGARQRPSRARIHLQTLATALSGAALALTLLASLALTGCASIAGEQSAETTFPVIPRGDGSFEGWNEITIEQDVNSVNKATLNAVTVEPRDEGGASDMTFIKSVIGEAVTSTTRTKLVEQTSMPPGERLISMDVAYTDDLREFFEDGHTIRVEWKGQTNLAYPSWPEEGIWVTVRVFVQIE